MPDSRFFKLPPFTRLDIAFGIRVSVVESNERVVRIEAERRTDLSRFRVEVLEGVLRIRPKFNLLLSLLNGDLFKPGRLTRETCIHIALPKLEGMSAATGANVSMAGFNADSLEVHAVTGAQILIKGISSSRLFVDAASGASITLGGSCENLSVTASSGARINALSLEATNAEIHAASASAVDCLARHAVRGEAASGARVRIDGNPIENALVVTSGAQLT